MSKLNISPKKEQKLLSKLASDITQQERFNKVMDLREQAAKTFNPRRVPENDQIKILVNEY